MKKISLLIISILLMMTLIACGKSNNPVGKTHNQKLSNEDYIQKMLKTVEKNYPNSLIDSIGVSDSSQGNFRGRINLADYEESTYVILHFPHTEGKIKRTINPWNQTESELKTEIDQLKKELHQNGLSLETISSTNYYKEEITNILAKNNIHNSQPLLINYSYNLAEKGYRVQCDFQLTVKKVKHLFVITFENDKVVHITCPTLDLVPIPEVEVFGKEQANQ